MIIVNPKWWLALISLCSSLLLGKTEQENTEFLFNTAKKARKISTANIGLAYVVDKKDFPLLNGVTCYGVEIFDESMRLPHWHPNASELGYVISGTIEIVLWRSPGETSVFTAKAGMSWFIPKGALHSLNNVSKEKATLLVGFSSEDPQNVDLPTAFNGIPVPVKDAYTSPHKDLEKWQGPIDSPLFGKDAKDPVIKDLPLTGSPYRFDLEQVNPLFSDPKLGSVTWGVKNNWPILKDLSFLRARLKPHVARDAIWYPDAGTLYVVTKGSGKFFIQSTGQETKPLSVKRFDYIFVPMGFLHTFMNNSEEDFEVVAFFNKEDPLPEVSLGVATSFFPHELRKNALTEYGDEKKIGDPLKHLKYRMVSPYLLPLKTAEK